MELGQSSLESVELTPEFWHDKRVLLTGHTGFKGSWLSLWLQSLGANLLGYSLPPPTDPSLYALAAVGRGMQSISGDVVDLEHLRRVMGDFQPQIVFHLAAQSLVPAPMPIRLAHFPPTCWERRMSSKPSALRSRCRLW